MSRFLLAVIRNCGVAIAISVFFAAARGPSQEPGPGAVDTVAAIAARYSESTAPAPMALGCDQPAIRVCRLVDAGQRVSERAP
jgi:hypothetical protein